jgi:hypothetical protein
VGRRREPPGAQPVALVSAKRWQAAAPARGTRPRRRRVGLAPRVQLSASTAVAGGSAPVSSRRRSRRSGAGPRVRRQAPTLQPLGAGIVDSLGPQQSRVRWGRR